MEEVVYPVIDKLPGGRRRVGVGIKGQPAKDVEHSSGWVIHPDDVPVHAGLAPIPYRVKRR